MSEGQIRLLIALGFSAVALYYFMSRDKAARQLANTLQPVTITPMVPTTPDGLQPVTITPMITAPSPPPPLRTSFD